MPQSADVVSVNTLKKLLGAGLEAASRSARRSRRSERDSARLQAAYARAQSDLTQEPRRPGVMFATQNRVASLLQSEFARRAGEIGRIRELPDGALEAVFDDNDAARYVAASMEAKILHPRRFTWVDPPDRPDKRLSKHLRIALFGDWGTGLYGAPAVARQIQSDRHGFDLVIHLGDTYYAGQDWEIRDRLIKYWPWCEGAIHRSLNGNHEMYANGRPYIRAVQAFGQQSSCFWFQNDDWILIGLDTAYNGYLRPYIFDITRPQQKWLQRVVRQAGDRRILLFSHHYLFSAFDRGGFELRDRIGTYVPMERMFAWYWGHEHRCTLYEWSERWHLFGRCLGHGGYPYFRDLASAPPRQPRFVAKNSTNGAPACRVLDGANPHVVNHEHEYGPHGYMVLELEGRRITEHVVGPDGRRPVWSGELKRKNAGR